MKARNVVCLCLGIMTSYAMQSEDGYKGVRVNPAMVSVTFENKTAMAIHIEGIFRVPDAIVYTGTGTEVAVKDIAIQKIIPARKTRTIDMPDAVFISTLTNVRDKLEAVTADKKKTALFDFSTEDAASKPLNFIITMNDKGNLEVTSR